MGNKEFDTLQRIINDLKKLIESKELNKEENLQESEEETGPQFEDNLEKLRHKIDEYSKLDRANIEKFDSQLKELNKFHTKLEEFAENTQNIQTKFNGLKAEVDNISLIREKIESLEKVAENNKKQISQSENFFEEYKNLDVPQRCDDLENLRTKVNDLDKNFVEQISDIEESIQNITYEVDRCSELDQTNIEKFDSQLRELDRFHTQLEEFAENSHNIQTMFNNIQKVTAKISQVEEKFGILEKTAKDTDNQLVQLKTFFDDHQKRYSKNLIEIKNKFLKLGKNSTVTSNDIKKPATILFVAFFIITWLAMGYLALDHFRTKSTGGIESKTAEKTAVKDASLDKNAEQGAVTSLAKDTTKEKPEKEMKSKETLLFHNDFTSDKLDWEENKATYLEDEKLKIDTDYKNALEMIPMKFNPKNILLEGVFKSELDSPQSKNQFYGFYYNLKNLSNYSVFIIRDNNFFISTSYNGRWYPMFTEKNYSKFVIVPNNNNKLSIKLTSLGYHFFINDKLVHTEIEEEEIDTSLEFGIFAEPDLQILVSDLKITKLEVKNQEANEEND